MTVESVVVPERVVNGRTILPTYRMAIKTHRYWPYRVEEDPHTGKPRPIEDPHVSPAEALALISPTLLQLRHGYENSPQIKQNICELEHYKTNVHELIRGMINPAKQKMKGRKLLQGEVVVNFIVPERIYYDSKNKLRVEGQTKKKVLPPEGWQGPDGEVFFDEDGFPIRTYRTKDEAMDAFTRIGVSKGEATNLASPFSRRRYFSEALPIARYWTEEGPWALIAGSGSDHIRVVGNPDEELDPERLIGALPKETGGLNWKKMMEYLERAEKRKERGTYLF